MEFLERNLLTIIYLFGSVTFILGLKMLSKPGSARQGNIIALVLGFLAVILGTLNVVGGFVVTDRMLEMFKKKK